MNLKALEKELKNQVQREYTQGFEFIRSERERKRLILDKVLDPNPTNGKVRVNLLDRNIQLEQALFLTDEVGVKFIAEDGVLSNAIMDNANLVAQYDDIDMELRYNREAIINYNALYGVAVTVIDAYDESENQPIADVVNPLNCIFDPYNYSGSKMRYFGIERRVTRDYVESDAFSIKDVMFTTSEELNKTYRSQNTANNLSNTIIEDEGMVDIYDHFITYKGKKYLTTWASDREILIRAIEIEPMTEAERRKPGKVKFPVQLHRRKPRLGSPFGQSIADEVLQFQDVISQLTNLQLIQANNLALGPDIFVDDRLGIDTEILATKQQGGRIIPISNDSQMPTQNGIYTQQLPTPSPFIGEMVQNLELRSEQTTNVTQQSFGVSQSGTQTKAEIQTLQQNQNQILMWISNNYLQGQKEYWECHYRSYVDNMSPKAKKVVSLYSKGYTTSKVLTRSEFVSEGKFHVIITSKSQDQIENDKEFNKLIAISELYLSNMKPGYGMNSFLRKIGQKTNIRDFDETRYIIESPDEMEARKNLEILNRNEEVPPPQDGQDYMTYLLIYRQALKNDASRKAVNQYERAYMELQKKEEEMKALQSQGQGSKQMSAMATNNLNQQNQAVSTSQVTL